jgi:hypothetical protein
MRDIVPVARDAGEAFHVTVPGGQVRVADGPVDGEPVAGRGLELVVAPPLRLPGPDEGFAAHLVAANPVEGLFLHVGVFLVLHEKVFGGLLEGVAATHHGIFGLHVEGKPAAVREVPGVFGGSGIILDVLHVPAAFEHQRFEAFFAKFLGRPAAADARADHNGIVGLLRLGLSGKVHIFWGCCPGLGQRDT